MIANKKEFDESLHTLGNLYEEAKDCLNYIMSEITPGSEEEKRYLRLFDIVREMRDLSAVTMQKLHFKIDN